MMMTFTAETIKLRTLSSHRLTLNQTAFHVLVGYDSQNCFYLLNARIMCFLLLFLIIINTYKFTYTNITMPSNNLDGGVMTLEASNRLIDNI